MVKWTNVEITREMVKAHPECAFLFGDNLRHTGKAGQAIIRGLPNAFGVPTKKLPSMEPGSFFNDDELNDNAHNIIDALKLVPNDGRRIVIHEGIGRGLSKMHLKAPKTYAFMLGAFTLIGRELAEDKDDGTVGSTPNDEASGRAQAL